MYIIPSSASKRLTSDTTFSNYLLIVDAYFNITKNYGMQKISTEQVMDKQDVFQSRTGKINEFGWWELKTIIRCRVANLPQRSSNTNAKLAEVALC